MKQKIAVVLFNLGGPDRPEAIRPFLRNLFSDPRIIGLPTLLRLPLAAFLSTRRAPKVKPLYDLMGGASPLLANTQAQATALQEKLNEGFGIRDSGFRVFICMRYWHPFAAETIETVKAWGPDKIVLLPLYPQFSTTTTQSSLEEWSRLARDLNIPTETICCYPEAEGFVAAQSALLEPLLEEARGLYPGNPPRVLFSAHGLPRKIIDKKGDPYVWQVEQTASAIARASGIGRRASDIEWRVTYQSRVGPVEWVKPYTDEEIRRAGAEGKPLIVVPVAFVSEHIETLVELDIENRHLAEASGCPGYWRAPTVGAHPLFIAALAQKVRKAPENRCERRCPAGYAACGQGVACTPRRSMP